MRLAPLLLLILITTASAKDIPISDLAQLPTAEPGDTLILPTGEFRDIALHFSGQGTQDKPITLRAALPGQTVFTGKSTLRISGQHLIVEGLKFSEPDPTVSDLILFRKDSETLANHCRLTGCTIISTQKQNASQESRWLGLYGIGHRIDHCEFTGKTGKGTTLVIWLGQDGDGRHQIDHNYFGPRERLGKNGGETIRVGDSKTSMMTAACIIEHNLFQHCNGEAECISNKSCGNLYRENTFLEVSGTLTLRHGNACIVERNVFIGNKANGTGGIRIIGEDHIVRDNYLENLTGDDARSAICLMQGVPDSPLNGYFQVKRARITGNQIVNCEHPILIGMADGKGTLPPLDTHFENNRVLSPKHPAIEARCPTTGITWNANNVQTPTLGIPPVPGIALTPPEIKALIPIDRKAVGPQ